MVARETSLSQGITELGVVATDVQVRKLAQFAEILEKEAIPMGFLGPNEAPRIVSRHVLESAALLPHLPEGALADVGSGAGLPGIVLAVLGRDVTLIESLSRRAEFLRSCAGRLDVPATVAAIRAEDAGRDALLRDTFAGVIARALAHPATALELCAPLAATGAQIVLLASESDPSLATAAGLLACAEPQRIALEVPGAPGPRWVIIVEKIGPTPQRYPRRPGVPKRRPLG